MRAQESYYTVLRWRDTIEMESYMVLPQEMVHRNRHHHRLRHLLLIFLVAAGYCLSSCRAQVPIPERTDGFVYGVAAAAAAWGAGSTVVVEAFFDPLCPDSHDGWPPLKEAVEHFSPRVSVVVHLFPLPYHSNAFLASRSLHIVNKLNASFVYPLLERFFKYQEDYYNQPTYFESRASIVARMIKLAVPIIGEAHMAALKTGFNDSQTDETTRISFKYGCSRGVTGTPYFFVNGIPLYDSGSPLPYSKWISILDPLIGKM